MAPSAWKRIPSHPFDLHLRQNLRVDLPPDLPVLRKVGALVSKPVSQRSLLKTPH